MFDSKKRMIETMQLFGLKESTQKIYSGAIENIAKNLDRQWPILPLIRPEKRFRQTAPNHSNPQ